MSRSGRKSKRKVRRGPSPQSNQINGKKDCSITTTNNCIPGARIPKKFSVRNASQSLIKATDYVKLAQCKSKTGPQGAAMNEASRHIPKPADLPCELRTLSWINNRGVKYDNKRRHQQDVKYLRKVSPETPEGYFYYFDYGTNESKEFAKTFQIPIDKLVRIDETWQCLDSFEDGRDTCKHKVFFDEEDGTFLCCIPSARHCATHLGGRQKCLERSNLLDKVCTCIFMKLL